MQAAISSGEKRDRSEAPYSKRDREIAAESNLITLPYAESMCTHRCVLMSFNMSKIILVIISIFLSRYLLQTVDVSLFCGTPEALFKVFICKARG